MEKSHIDNYKHADCLDLLETAHHKKKPDITPPTGLVLEGEGMGAETGAGKRMLVVEVMDVGREWVV